jgi:SUKH superfamily protein
MSLEDARRAIASIEGNPSNHMVIGGRPESLVTAAEQTLGLTFPPSYRAFLRRLGAGGVGPQEIYGVVDADFENSSVPDAVWVTLGERRRGLDQRFVVVGETGLGEWYVLDCSDPTDEGMVAVTESGGQQVEMVSSDFGEFIWSIVDTGRIP